MDSADSKGGYMKSNFIKMLVISDNHGFYRRVSKLFADGRVAVHLEGHCSLPLPHFDSNVYDVVLLVKTDSNKNDVNFIEVVNHVKSQESTAQTQTIVLTADDNSEARYGHDPLD